MCVCSREAKGQPGPMGRLGPSSAITVMVGSNSLSEWEVSNPFVLACLTIREFETQGLNLQGPTWLPRLELEDRTGCSTGSHFSCLEVQKGHPLWRPVLYHGTEGPEDGRKLGRRGITLGSRATSPLHSAFGLGTTDTNSTFCLSPGLSLHCLGGLSTGPRLCLHRQLEPKPETAQAFLSPKLN